MSLLLFFIVFVWFNNTLLVAQTDIPPITHIEFICSAYDNNELCLFADTRSTLDNIEELPDVLDRLYRSLTQEGYPLARLDSITNRYSDKGSILDIYISTGKPFKLESSRLIGYKDDITEITPVSRLTSVKLLKQAEELLDEMTDNGYPFAKVTITPNHIQEQEKLISAKIDFNVEKGYFTRIGDVEFPGARLTSKRLLRLESRLRSGEAFSRSELERAVERLERLPYVAYVDDPRLLKEGYNVVDIHIPIEERRVNQLSGVLSAAPGEAKPTGEFKIQFGNILGTGRKLRLEWLGLDPSRRGIQVSYREPWILSHPYHATVEFEQWIEDTLSATTRYKSTLEWEPSYRLTFSGSIASEYISGSDSAVTDIGSHAIWLQGGIKYNSFDNDWNPTLGFSAGISSASAVRYWHDGARGSSRLRRDEASVAYVRSIYHNLILFERLGFSDISGSGVVLEELTRLGGIGSVRGYEESSILSRGAGWAAIELRWRPDNESYLGLFTDVGYAYRVDPRIKPRKEFPLSFGITAMMLTKAGRLGLDLALAEGEAFQNARLHLRLEGWF
ncbi:MAG: POTRA domain-containing protein [Candidatus Hatepunaea meridiana]|nr:POTRA domain-containing protein [Candidatus Hatepunaea meridiana]